MCTTSIFIIVCLLLAATLEVKGHSYILCSNWDAAAYKCKAYPRYFSSNLPGGYKDRNLQGASPCPQSPIAGTGPLYTGAYPALKVKAGGVIKPSWAERGHSSQGQSSSDFLYKKTSSFGQDGSLAQYKLLKSVPFKSNCKPDVPLSGDSGAQHCWTALTIPKSLAPGKYTVVWQWNFKATGTLSPLLTLH